MSSKPKPVFRKYSLSDLALIAHHEQDISLYYKLPNEVLSEDERIVKLSAINFYEEHGAVPSAKMLEEMTSDPWFATDLTIPLDPGSAVLESLVKKLKVRESKRIYDQVSSEEFIDGVFNLDKLVKRLTQLQRSTSPEHVTMTDFDRDSLYDRTGLERAVYFGIESLDKLVNGVLPGEFAVITSRPGVGKSMFICHLATTLSMQGKRVYVVSKEMPPEQLMHRIDATLGAFNPIIFRDQSVTKEEMSKYKSAAKDGLRAIKESGGDVIFPRAKVLTIDSIRGELDKQKPDVLLIDGIYLMQVSSGRSYGANWERVMSVSNAIKTIALELDIPVIGTSQLKRSDNNDANLSLQDVGYSDAIGQDADVVMAAWKEKDAVDHILGISALKCRHGSDVGTSWVQIDWSKSMMFDMPYVAHSINFGDQNDES